jgi:Protein of unknown function (DUF3106)
LDRFREGAARILIGERPQAGRGTTTSENNRRGEMRRARFITEWLVAASLAATVLLPLPSLAQRPRYAGLQGRPLYQQRQQRGRGQHAGDWLRRYKDLPPKEQERALQNDPQFRRLPPERQQQLRQRLQHFSTLPPEQQQRVLNRMETWEHLTPEQKLQARQFFGQMQQLPPDRRRMVNTAIRDLRAMPPRQREEVINSERFRGMFSPQEREMLRGATRLPLASPEGGEQPQE